MTPPNTPPHSTDYEMIRVIGDQIADRLAMRMKNEHPEPKKMEIPAPLKWGGAMLATAMSAGSLALVIWIVSTLAQVQLDVKGISTKLESGDPTTKVQIATLEQRVNRLEKYHEGGGR